MINGSLSTMSLADLLQWVAATGISGTLFIEREAATIWMQLANRTIVAASSPPTLGVPHPDGHSTDKNGAAMAVGADVLALELLFDQFLDSEDNFRFTKGDAQPEPAVVLDVTIQEFVMQGMRHLDEWPRINELYGSDMSKIHAEEDATSVGLTPIQRAVLGYARKNATLSQARLGLGVSRPSLLRRVEELRVLGRVSVDGTPAGGDLFSKLVGQASILLRERQFDEAAHVFSALLAADPSAVQVKQLFREAETKQVESLYQDLPPSAVVVPLESGTGDRNRLTASDCQVLDRVNGRWDVSVLVLASPLREVETLKSLRKLLNLRFIKLRIPKRVARSRSQTSIPVQGEKPAAVKGRSTGRSSSRTKKT